MNKKTVALTTEEYESIITTIQNGFRSTPNCPGLRPNPRVATALVIEANLGLRIGDVLQLKPSSFVKDGPRYHLDVVEEKTGKRRTFTVPAPIYVYIENYWLRNGIGQNERILPISIRSVQAILKQTCDYLGLHGVSTHSFRKFYATEIYHNSGFDVVLVQRLLQHSSPTTTLKYIGINQKQMEDAILQHMKLL